jgi:hypothetical protein
MEKFDLPLHDGGYLFGSHSIFDTYNLAIASRMGIKSIHDKLIIHNSQMM